MLLDPEEEIGEDGILRKLKQLGATSEVLSQRPRACKSYFHVLPAKNLEVGSG